MENRALGLDLCRLLAAAAICWLHTWESQLRPRPGELGRFAVPFFVVTAICLMCRSAPTSRRSFKSYVWNRFRRIYVPFLAWSVIYLFVTDLKHRFITHEPPFPVALNQLLVGTAAQLWFLPFLFIANVIFYLPCKSLFQRPSLLPLTGLFAAAIAVAICLLPYPARFESYMAVLGQSITHTDLSKSYFISFSWGAVPSVFFGIALAALLHFFQISKVGFLAAVAVPLCMFWVYDNGRNILLENVAGLALAIAAFVPLRSAWARPLARLGPLAYGIYLSHYLIPEGIRAFTVKHHIPNLTPYVLVECAAVIVLSIVMSVLLARYKATRWLTGL